MPAIRYRPGETVPASGIYKVVDVFRVGVGREITCEQGEPFPPTVDSGEYGFVLIRETIHERP
jgi:hypothetical protein